MRVQLLRPQELSGEQLSTWQDFLRQDPLLASPFLQPAFTRTVAVLRPDVEVALIEEAGRISAFLPFQRKGRVGRPVGGGLSDCQAVIAAPGWDGEARRVIRATGLGVLAFTQARAAQRFFAPHARRLDASPVIDLRGGFAAYAEERRRAGSSIVTQTLSHARRLERRLGPLRFVLHDPRPGTLHRLIAWKRAQYGRDRWGGALDPFARSWIVDLLERIHAMQEQDFAGVLSTLHAGNTMVAAHFGMRCPQVLHYWFPAYDTEHAKLAPGRVLLLEMIRGAAAAGLGRIELGAGDEGYKGRFANATIPVAAGFAGPPSWPLFRHWLWDAAIPLARRVPIGRGRRADEVLFRLEWQRSHA